MLDLICVDICVVGRCQSSLTLFQFRRIILCRNLSDQIIGTFDGVLAGLHDRGGTKEGGIRRCSVTRFDKNSPLWQKFTSLWQILDSLFLIWQNAEPTLANL